MWKNQVHSRKAYKSSHDCHLGYQKVKEWAGDLRVLDEKKKKIGLNLKSVNQAGEVVKWTGKQTDTKAKPQWHNIRVLYSWEAKHSHGLYLVFCHNFSLRVKHKTLLKYLSPSKQAQSQTRAKRPVSFNQNGSQLQETALLNFHQTKIILRRTKK